MKSTPKKYPTRQSLALLVCTATMAAAGCANNQQPYCPPYNAYPYYQYPQQPGYAPQPGYPAAPAYGQPIPGAVAPGAYPPNGQLPGGQPMLGR